MLLLNVDYHLYQLIQTETEMSAVKHPLLTQMKLTIYKKNINLYSLQVTAVL